ncbi:hypothetical protein [Jeotgalibacillus sp. ET6]|uniref:hypothetical protein n=1 Tax=Jeotgalibacillus TaxID=157226 RepID=UPI0024185D8D|nr:hypothetical protein [Jeotgalibacillus sp. ET6]MDG5470973.1 hypothetical protein [Jeotgalibacillus sp. ET6]
MAKRMFPKPMPPWWKKCRTSCQALIIPFCCFQTVRLILLPTTFDVLLLGILIGIACVLYFEWI